MSSPSTFAEARPGAQADLRQRVLKGYLLALAAVAALGVLIWAGVGLGPGQPLGVRVPAMLGFAALAVAAFVTASLKGPPAEVALLSLTVAAELLVGTIALVTGWGLTSPGLLSFAVMVCMATALGTPTTRRAASAVAVVVLLVLALAEWLGRGPPRAAADPPTQMWLLVHGAVLVLGVVGGNALARLAERHQATALLRERRFHTLLGIAAAAYWETDDQLQLRRLTQRDADGQFSQLPRTTGRLPWDIGALRLAPDVADTLRADMENRAPLRDLPCQWLCTDGSLRHLLISGEARHDADGRFIGYWGVVRDFTVEHEAQRALQAAERRHHDLFVHLPTALVLHRDGLVIDANPAAAQLLGYTAASRLIGRDLMAEHLDASGREVLRRDLDQLALLPAGEPLAPLPLRLHSLAGDAVEVRMVASRVDVDGAAAVLSILSDETASLAAARAQQRSEALFAQVLSTSPDLIMLADAANGQLLMVNQAFSRVLGWRADQVVGRSAAELGLWRSPSELAQFEALLLQRPALSSIAAELVDRHGQTVPLLLSATRFERDGRPRVVINARQVDDASRLRIEREAILSNASVGIAFTRGLRFELVNPAFEQIYGWPPGSLAGQSNRVLWPAEGQAEQLGRDINDALRRGEVAEVEREGMRHDGTPILVRLRAKALDPLHPGQGTIWIAEDVTRQREDARALTRARDEAEAASRAKSTFLANTSHEIRTPLNSLLGLARSARQPGVSPQQLRDCLDQMAENAETLSVTISDILDLSKIEAGKLEVNAAAFDLRELLHALQQAYAALAAGHGLAFAVEIDRALAGSVYGDALRVRQILSNYLHNALKYTTSGSIRLVVQCRPADVVRFEVHDSGPGLDEATQARLFTPFGHGDEGNGRRLGGSGLGLSICQELANLMGGTVGVQSSAGQGSCFFAELPLPPATPASESDRDRAADSRLLHGVRVLLAEDNAVNLMIASALLEQWGMRVTSVSDGQQCLSAVADAAAAGAPIQVGLLDVQMPVMDGFAVAAALRQRHSAAELPLIALTAAALHGEGERAAEVGMNGFVNKPIDAEKLRAALVDVIRSPAQT